MPERDVLINGAGFADQLRVALNLTGDPEDRILVEVGSDIDRLEELVSPRGVPVGPTLRLNIIRTRLQGLRQLQDMIYLRKDRLEKEGGATLIASLVIRLAQVMEGLNLTHEIRQAVVNNLLIKIEEDEKERKRTAHH